MLATFAFWSPAARAQTRDADATAPNADGAHDADLRARVDFEVGRTAFEERRYEDALEAFERSYALSGRPQLLYNIGQSADRLRRDARALEAFERFLAELPESPLRAPIEERIVLLRAAIAARMPVRTSAAAPSPPRTESRRSLLAPAVLLGVGGLLVVGGATSLIAGVVDRDSVEGADDGTTFAELEAAADRAPLLMNAGLAILGVGLVAASIGLVWVLVPSANEEEAAVALSPTVGGLLVTGAF